MTCNFPLECRGGNPPPKVVKILFPLWPIFPAITQNSKLFSCEMK